MCAGHGLFFTEPSFDVLRKYMMEYGGTFEHYYSATRVTHIIATSMALSKQKLFQNKKVTSTLNTAFFEAAKLS